MMRMKHVMMLGFLGLIGLQACKSKNTSESIDTYDKGSIRIAVDESFQNVIEQQLEMYKASYPLTEIKAEYKPEALALKDFFNDTSIAVAIVARKLTRDEEKQMHDKYKYYPKWNLVAKDAIALVVHSSNSDSLLTTNEIIEILKGTYKNKYSVIFDGLNATSTFRFVMDSLMRGEKISDSLVMAGKDSKEVLEYVATHPESIGFVGVSWIGNPESKEQREMLKRVKIVSVKNDGDSTYVYPHQMQIQFNNYPLVRGLYYLVKENYQGLGTGFTNFLRSERGQKIFRRAYLAPLMELEIRNVYITE